MSDSNPGAYWVCMEPHGGVYSRKGLRSGRTPVLLALGRLSLEDWRSDACLSCKVRPCCFWGLVQEVECADCASGLGSVS